MGEVNALLNLPDLFLLPGEKLSGPSLTENYKVRGLGLFESLFYNVHAVMDDIL